MIEVPHDEKVIFSIDKLLCDNVTFFAGLLTKKKNSNGEWIVSG